LDIYKLNVRSCFRTTGSDAAGQTLVPQFKDLKNSGPVGKLWHSAFNAPTGLTSENGPPFEWRLFETAAQSLGLGQDFVEKEGSRMRERWEETRATCSVKEPGGARKNVLGGAAKALLMAQQRFCFACLDRFVASSGSDIDHTQLKSGTDCALEPNKILRRSPGETTFNALMDGRHACKRCHRQDGGASGAVVSAAEKRRLARLVPLRNLLHIALVARAMPALPRVSGLDFVCFDLKHNDVARKFIPGTLSALGFTGTESVSHIVCAYSSVQESRRASAAVAAAREKHTHAQLVAFGWLVESLRSGFWEVEGRFPVQVSAP